MITLTLNKTGYSESNRCRFWRTWKIMIRHLYALWVLVWLGLNPVLGVYADTVARQTAENPSAAATDTKATNAIQLAPGPNDGRIAYWTARLLEDRHYRQQHFDAAVSEKFFDRYIETLDPQHLHFLESDLAEFDRYRTNLDKLTISTNRVADTMPAYEIFNRFLQRLEQRVNYAAELLKNEKFEFNNDERIVVNRRKAPYPNDLAEAKELWRQRRRDEYLEEKLSRVGAKKQSEAAPGSVPSEKPGGDQPAKPPEPAKEVKKQTDAEEIVDLMTRRYHRNLRMFQEWDNTDVLEFYLTSLAHVYDPHSDYLNASQSENFSINMSLSLFGIGAVLTTDLDGYCKIVEVKPGPAMRSKQLKAEDRIVAVAQGDQAPVNVENMKLNNVVQMIRGPKGTEVRLTIMPAGSSERKVLDPLIRDEIKLEDGEAKAAVIEMPNGSGKRLRLGVIDLPSFYANFDVLNTKGHREPKSTTADVSRLLGKLKQENTDGVILDLRRNGGGSLPEAITLTGLFIKGGPVVMVGAPDGRVQVDGDDNPTVLYDGPLIVLTSRFSASASEILAGALQDYGRALIVGDISTHGKGTVQSLTPLRQEVPELADLSGTNDPGALKMTIRKFYRPSGASTQLKGVLPDIVLPSVWNYSTDIGESALENALTGDPIRRARYEPLNRVGPYLSELLKRSSERVAANQDFAYVRDDIELFKKVQADKSISLNERQRLKEKEEADARQKDRDKELLARKEPDQKVHELTLRDVDKPGLPPPVEKTNSAVAKGLGFGGGGAPAVGTNSASIATKMTEPGINSGGADEKWSSEAAILAETERILADYISLLRQKSLITVNH